MRGSTPNPIERRPIMDDGAPNDPNALATARIEFVEIANNLRAGVTVLWDAFKTYFTISGAMFAGFGFLQSTTLPFPRVVSLGVSSFIAVGGFVVTILACFGIARIIEYQRKFLERGAAVESQLGTQLMDASGAVWKAHNWIGADKLTYIVFSIFAVPWLLAAIYCYGQLSR
jgi:hypothetical protein